MEALQHPLTGGQHVSVDTCQEDGQSGCCTKHLTTTRFGQRHSADSPDSTTLETRDDQRCSVCGDHNSSMEDPLLQCGHCSVRIHMSCGGYALHVPQHLGQFLCHSCLHNACTQSAGPETATRRCELCPNLGGALAQVEGSNGTMWVHIMCAIWVPEISFADPETLSLVRWRNKDRNVLLDRFKLKCKVCGLRNVGACIQCSEKKCFTAMHVSCAMSSGKYLQYGENGRGDLELVCFCKRHEPEELKGAPHSLECLNMQAMKFPDASIKARWARGQGPAGPLLKQLNDVGAGDTVSMAKRANLSSSHSTKPCSTGGRKRGRRREVPLPFIGPVESRSRRRRVVGRPPPARQYISPINSTAQTRNGRSFRERQTDRFDGESLIKQRDQVVQQEEQHYRHIADAVEDISQKYFDGHMQALDGLYPALGIDLPDTMEFWCPSWLEDFPPGMSAPGEKVSILSRAKQYDRHFCEDRLAKEEQRFLQGARAAAFTCTFDAQPPLCDSMLPHLTQNTMEAYGLQTLYMRASQGRFAAEVLWNLVQCGDKSILHVPFFDASDGEQAAWLLGLLMKRMSRVEPGLDVLLIRAKSAWAGLLQKALGSGLCALPAETCTRRTFHRLEHSTYLKMQLGDFNENALVRNLTPTVSSFDVLLAPSGQVSMGASSQQDAASQCRLTSQGDGQSVGSFFQSQLMPAALWTQPSSLGALDNRQSGDSALNTATELRQVYAENCAAVGALLVRAQRALGKEAEAQGKRIETQKLYHEQILPSLSGEGSHFQHDLEAICSVCKGGESAFGNLVVICDSCEKGFHQECHQPKITKEQVGDDVWFCANCVKTQQGNRVDKIDGFKKQN